jgi:type IV pilus biogenesis protein CpaD/CtpE
MFNHSKNTLAIALLSLALAGCVTDEMYTTDISPYGGSKMHPIKVSGGKAYVEGCGQWPHNIADTESNEMHDNHGCAVQSNIAAMAAYPSDLVGKKRKLPKPLGDVGYTAISRMYTNVSPVANSTTP